MSKQSDLVTVARDAGASGYVNVTGDTMTGALAVNVAAASSTTDALVVQNSGVGSVGHTTGLRFRYITAEPAAIRAVLTSTASGEGRLGLFTSSDGSGAGLVERLGVDSAGRVTMPGQPAFHAAGTGQLIPSDGQVMPFSTAVTNRGSHYNTSTYRFTAPVSGVYLLAARATWSDSGSGPVPHIAINGAAVGGSTTYTQLFGYNSVGGYHTTSAVAAPVSMNAGDYADVRVSIFNSSAGRFDLTRCSFSGYLIG